MTEFLLEGDHTASSTNGTAYVYENTTNIEYVFHLIQDEMSEKFVQSFVITVSLIVHLLKASYFLYTHKYSGNKGAGKKGRDFYSSVGGLIMKKVWQCKVVANETGKSRTKTEGD